MDNNYIITPNGTFISESELYHHGTRGMKWGIRRYQNKDGSLTAAGRKRYGDSDGDSGTGRGERDGKSTSTRGPKKPAPAKATKPDDKAKAKNEEEAKKQQSDDKNDKTPTETKTSITPKPLDEISDKNLQARLNRMNNEEQYNKKMAERGYVQVSQFTDMDMKIAELTRQKQYMTLQKEVKALDKELNPKKESKVKKAMNAVLEKVVAPAATEAGKKVLESYLTEKGLSLIKKEADKEAEKLAAKEKKVQDAFAKEKAKAEAKEAEKNAKRSAEEYAKTETKNESANYRSKGGKRSQVDPNESRALAVYDKPVSSFSSTIKSKGQSYTNKKYSSLDDDDYVTVTDNSPKSSISTTKSSTISLGQRSVAGYLSAPASSASSSTIALGERKVAGYLSAPTSSISGYLPAPSSSSSGSSKKKRFSTSITKNATGTSARINNMKATGNYTNAEIAKKLGVSESTVDRYLYGGDD